MLKNFRTTKSKKSSGSKKGANQKKEIKLKQPSRNKISSKGSGNKNSLNKVDIVNLLSVYHSENNVLKKQITNLSQNLRKNQFEKEYGQAQLGE